MRMSLRWGGWFLSSAAGRGLRSALCHYRALRYPLGHLRRGGGSISALRVTGDPAKGDPGGEAPRPRPPPPSFTGVLFVTGDRDLPLATQRRGREHRF